MITVIKTPLKFQPSENPNIFQVESNNSNILYFIVEVREAVSNGLISKSNIYTRMETPQGSSTDLSGTLQNYVNWEVRNTIMEIGKALTKPVLSYKVTFTEMGIVSGSYTALSAPYTVPDVFTVWNAKMDKINFDSYSTNQYLINNSNVVKFLTYKPATIEVNQYSFEQLYFLYDGSEGLVYELKIYNKAGVLQSTSNFSIATTSKIYYVQASPRALSNAGITYAFTDGDYYTITIKTESGVYKTETRKYIFKSLPCHLEPVNIAWINSLGGLDSYQFINPQDSLNVTRSTIKKNTFKIDSGNYSDKTDGIYNVSDEIYANTSSVSFKAFTQVLSDEDVYWLGEMIRSKQLFIELSDRTLVPTTVTNTNFSYQRQKYKQGELNVMQFEFTLAENIIPALSNRSISFVQGTTFYNIEKSGVFQKNSCGAGFVGSFVTYTVPAGAYVSYISQADADILAETDVTDNGQDYANSNGTCTESFGNEEMSETFIKNDCIGGTGSAVVYTIPENTYFGESVAAANGMAIGDLEGNGQAYANANGTCTPITSGNSIITNYSAESFNYTIIINGTSRSVGTISPGQTIYFDAPLGFGNDVRVLTTTHTIGTILVRSGSVSIPMAIDNVHPLNHKATNASSYTIVGGLTISVERIEVEISYIAGEWNINMNHSFTSELEFINAEANGYSGTLCSGSVLVEADTMPSMVITAGSTSASVVTAGLTGLSDKYKLGIYVTILGAGIYRHNIPFILTDTPFLITILNTTCSPYGI